MNTAQPSSSDSSYRQRLVNELIQRQRKNPSYSLRGFARDLGISPAALSQSLNKKRNLSKVGILSIADRLSFTPSETQSALREIRANPGKVADESFSLLQDDTFKYISDWYYFAIHALARTGKAKASPTWIAERFGLSELEARDALARLERLELTSTKNGKLVHNGKFLRTTSDVPSAAARNLQHHHLRLAGISLESDPIGLRDMTSMTMAVRRNKIPEAKQMIKTFRRKLAKLLDAKDGEEVYVLAVQLFPVTKGVSR